MPVCVTVGGRAVAALGDRSDGNRTKAHYRHGAASATTGHTSRHSQILRESHRKPGRIGCSRCPRWAPHADVVEEAEELLGRIVT